MSGNWVNILVIVISVTGSYLTTRVAVRASQRKTDAESRKLDAESRKIAAEEASVVATNQRAILADWSKQLKEHATRAAKQDQHIAGLEKRLEAIDSDLQDAHEQNDLLANQLNEERRANRILTATLETAQAQLRAALAELENAKQQIKVLIEHAKRVDEWWQIHYSTNGHTNDKDKPPTLTPFEDDAEGAG